ncbi:MAG TPA: hypothetical protein DIW15_05190 [Bavariicoccus seileri]|uniref:Uncharacterized protein n=1 Tax=Bavariicoccus seileri TaxID=549685 RepID=A0A3D4S5J0_9ENTE|nr:hypothetical protein [Bavariicoccus seileri]
MDIITVLVKKNSLKKKGYILTEALIAFAITVMMLLMLYHVMLSLVILEENKREIVMIRREMYENKQEEN